MFTLSVVLALLGAPETDRQQDDLFERRIRPVLIDHCYGCHSKQSGLPKGDLRLDTRAALRRGGKSGPILVPGKPEESRLLSALRHRGSLKMPPDAKLPDRVVADFEQWIRAGAPDPREEEAVVGSAAGTQHRVDFGQGAEHWSLKQPTRQDLPGVVDASWPRTAIDYFILAKLEANGLRPTTEANRYQLVRRLYFDLLGLPPTPTAVRSFVSDSSPNAYEKLVDRLFGSPHYGERWGRRWLDVARYAEDQAHTFRARRYPNGFRYRDWVVNAFNTDKPYNQFLVEQIAGDLLPASSPDAPERLERLSALGFFALGPVYYRDDKESTLKAIADDLEDRVDTLGRGLLGLSLACARCHDHKYDPVTTKDYYALAGIFHSSQYTEVPLVPTTVIEARKEAVARLAGHNEEVARFVVEQARSIRDTLAPRLADGLVATLKVALLKEKWKDEAGKGSADEREKDPYIVTGAQVRLPTSFIRRCENFLKTYTSETDVLLGSWNEQLAPNGEAADKSPAERLALGRTLAAAIQSRVENLLPDRETLFRRWGERVSFLRAADRAALSPGRVPLGNLFDAGPPGETLAAALVSDLDQARASTSSPWIERVVQGFAKPIEVAPGASFDFSRLGGDASKAGAVLNDRAMEKIAIRTEGEKLTSPARRQEDGIGLHANGLVTFNLAHLRESRQLDSGTALRFVSDRAGLNDSAFGVPHASAHLAVLVFSSGNTPELLALHVNGQSVAFERAASGAYAPDGTPPEPLRGDGRFARFEVALPPAAGWLALAATGAGVGHEGNTIHTDHAVFSGARIEHPAEGPAPDVAAEAESFADALVLSRLFAEGSGLLWLGEKGVAEIAEGASAAQLKTLQQKRIALQKEVDALPVPKAHSLTDREPRDLRLNIRGDPTHLGDIVPRGYLTVLSGPQQRELRQPRPFESDGSGRLELARAIASRENPLTARVIVNRLWQGLFGRGIVRTTSNFGILGDPPTHPQLLDYLAVELMDRDWSLKDIQREIVLSATYRLSSRASEASSASDPANLLLSRSPRKRLEVEPWRDAMLSVGGGLLPTIGGPSFRLEGQLEPRRTLYAHVSRHRLADLLRLFDFPDPNITSAERSRTTVPLQQLFVLNSEFMRRQAAALAEELLSQPADNEATRVRQAFLRVYARPPRSEEIQSALQFLSAANPAVGENNDGASRLSPWEQYALVLLGSNEFLYVD